MIESFIIEPLIAGLVIALVAGPLGCFMVWQRMAYFSDALSHASLLGVALGLVLHMNISLGILTVCLGFAVLLAWMQHQRKLAGDTLIAIFAHGALAVGLLTLSLMGASNLDLHGFLFGDILLVSRKELYWTLGGGALCLVILVSIWRPLLVLTINEELAIAEGVRVALIRFLFSILIAMFVALSMRIVGILLLTSLLVFPAATSRNFARTPETMAICAALIGSVNVLLGILLSVRFDLPISPAIVACAAIMLAGCGVWKWGRGKRNR